MPRRISDFRCNDCGEISEHYYSTDHILELKCLSCESENLTLLVGAPKIVTTHGTLSSRTPQGFKDVLKQTFKTVPAHAVGKLPSAI